MLGLADPSWPAIIAAVGAAVAAVLGGTATVISALARREQRATARTVDATNAAVNGKAPGELSIGDQVDDLHGELELDEGEAILPLLRAIADHLGVQR